MYDRSGNKNNTKAKSIARKETLTLILLKVTRTKQKKNLKTTT